MRISQCEGALSCPSDGIVIQICFILCILFVAAQWFISQSGLIGQFRGGSVGPWTVESVQGLISRSRAGGSVSPGVVQPF